MNKSQLKTGRNVLIRDISIDDMDEIDNLLEYVLDKGEIITVHGVSKQKTAYLRSGIAGGDFDNWGKKPNGSMPPDEVLKQLSADEREECVELIKETQRINPIKPFKSN